LTGYAPDGDELDRPPDEQEQFEALPLEEQASKLNEGEDYAGTDVVWRVVDGKLVRTVPPPSTGTLIRLRFVDRRLVVVRRRVTIRRSWIKQRLARARARRRRATARRSSSSTPGRQEDPEPPPRSPLEAAA
jgi:hypothetical protein